MYKYEEGAENSDSGKGYGHLAWNPVFDDRETKTWLNL